MNSGLPSLLDAIFGKQDLASVSLDEIYEVIREFPSFNAGHYLLAKKLKLQDDPAYEKESMRTALYFNNPFWLQSLLDDGNHFQPAESYSPVKETEDGDQFMPDAFQEETPVVIDEESDYTILEESNYTFESYTPIEKSAPAEDELDEEEEEILDEKLASDPVRSEDTFQYAEPGSQIVTSFDELMAKYKIQPLDMLDETAVEIPTESQPVAEADIKIEPAIESGSDILNVPETVSPAIEEVQLKPEATQDFVLPAAELNKESKPTTDSDEYETLKEVVNEYGIFEEIVVKKVDHDYDLDAFDRPLDQIPFVSERIVEEVPPAAHAMNTEDNAATEQIVYDENAVNTMESTTAEHTEITENSSIIEYQQSTDSPDKTDEHDYDSFDRPPEEPVQTQLPADEYENYSDTSDYDPDNTGKPVEYTEESDAEANGQMQEMSERFEEQQKVLSAFNAKNADSIVFTPYHMVDYFASQGIKLVLEDNPPDQFGKQLKSFTDWLKVMKRLPAQTSSDRQEEKEAEQIRHFAAHSIEERDILTESMAEVLAKQGMYENAIALLQKLSLIYPPKSAYFASRIEQLKASLP
jgi:tetratricopeptide (TPR) repeat protein